MVMGPALTDGDGGWYSHGFVDSRWEDSHPFNDYFLLWKLVADQRSYVPVVPAYQPTRPPYNPITGDPVLGHRGLNERTPLPDHYWEDQVTFAGIAVDILTLGAATPELAAAAAARAAAREIASSAAEAAAERGAATAAKGVTGAHDEALAGGKHAGFLKNYIDKPTPQIERGIGSIEKQIAEHQAKIRNPGAHIDDWASLDPRQQQALLNSKWPGDVARQQEQLDILRRILESR